MRPPPSMYQRISAALNAYSIQLVLSYLPGDSNLSILLKSRVNPLHTGVIIKLRAIILNEHLDFTA